MGPILVTGAAGFLGSTICRQLAEAGIEVRAYARRGSTHPTLDALSIERRWGDVNDTSALRQAMHGCRSIIHTVVLGRYSRRYWSDLHSINAQGTQTVLEASINADIEQIVLLDSISAFPVSRHPQVRAPQFGTDSDLLGLYPYLHSKKEARIIANQFENALRIVTLYCSPLYGAGDKHNHTGAIFQQLQRHRIVAAPPGGTSVVCVEDAARACILAATKLKDPAHLVVSAEHWSFAALYERILACVRPDGRIRHTLPFAAYYPAFAAAAMFDFLGSPFQFTPYLIRNGFRFRYYDAMETRSRLGWAPQVAIADAIDMQAEWMWRHGQLRCGPL